MRDDAGVGEPVGAWSRSTSGCRGTSRGAAGPCTPASGSSRSTARAEVRRLNLDGDGQGDLAGHGGEQRAVLVYQLDSYRHWARTWAATTSARGPSARTSPSTACPTTRSASVTATASATAVFEVTQPRVTCYRVGMRLGEPRTAGAAGRPPPARLLPAGRRGRRRRRRGRDRRVAAGPEGMTVAEVDALLYLPGHDRDLLAARRRGARAEPGLALPSRRCSGPTTRAWPATPVSARSLRRRPGPASGRCG